MIDDGEEDTKSFLRNLEDKHPKIHALIETVFDSLKGNNWENEWHEMLNDQIIKEFDEIGIGEFRIPPESRKKGITVRLYFCHSVYSSSIIILLFGEIKDRRCSRISIARRRREIYMERYEEIG
jgi:hypothetical protein